MSSLNHQVSEQETKENHMKSQVTSMCGKLSKAIGWFALIVICTVLAHWATVNAYVHMCAPFTLFGPIQAMITMGSPMCHFLNLFQTELTKHYISIWTGAIVGITAWLVRGK